MIYHTKQDNKKKRKEVFGWQPLHQRSKTDAAKPPATEDVIKVMEEKTKKMPADTPKSLETEPEPVVHSRLGNCLSDKLEPDYTEQSTANCKISRFWALNCHQPACFRGVGTDEKYEHVAQFLRVFLI